MASKVPIKIVVNDRVFAETVVDLFDRKKSVKRIAYMEIQYKCQNL
jgi:hypothetical protein